MRARAPFVSRSVSAKKAILNKTFRLTLAPAGCTNCGYVVFFNAIMMGLPFEHVIIADGAAGAS